MYYNTPGESDMYNSLSGEFVNRRYDLTDQFDTTGADQYLQQLQGLQEGQGMDNYSYEELQNIQNLLQQERDFDISPEQQAYQQYTQDLSAYDAGMPTDYTSQISGLESQLAGMPRQTAGQEYLEQRPDVAANAYFGANPYAHYQQYGIGEGMQWNPETERDIQINDWESQLTPLQEQQLAFDQYGPRPEEVLDPRSQGQMSQEFFLPETEIIDPQFRYSVEGVGGGKYKGFLEDPRMAQVGVADTLDKYYDYSNWGPGQKMRNEFAYMSGRTPGMAGSGNERIDPVTGQPLTAAREMTPEEYQWESKTPTAISQRVHSAEWGRPDLRQVTTRNQWYGADWDQLLGWDMTGPSYDRSFASDPDKYTNLGSWSGNPDALNYDSYQSQLGSSIQDYLAQNNLNSPV